MPVYSSKIVITDMKRWGADTLLAHATTFLFALPDFALRNSETTLISSKYTMTRSAYDKFAGW